MKSILKYSGSKWSSADWIVDNFPDDYESMTYLELFFGSGAIFFNKKRSRIETINDLDSNVFNLFKVIRDNPEELDSLIRFTPWSREEYQESYIDDSDPIEKARKFLVRCWQAIGTKTSDRSGWSNNMKPVDTGSSRWSRLHKSIYEISNRLRGEGMNLVQIENMPALELLRKYNKPYVFVYLDPPYLLSTRSKRIYKHEMTDQDHIELLEEVVNHKGFIMISGYESDLYNSYLEGWHKSYRKVNCEMGKQATEVIWMNYKPNTKQITMDLEGVI